MDHIDRAEPEPPLVGTTVTSHTAAPAGTWELVGHPGCELLGRLRALTSGETAPLCPACGAVVRWRLAHPAPNGANGDGRRHAT